MAENSEKKLVYKKWWFWTIIVLLIILLVETVFIYLKNTAPTEEVVNSSTSPKEDLMSLTRQINTTLGSSNIYCSADGSLMFIELRNWKNEYNNTKLKELFEILTSDYCKENIDTVTITTYIEEPSSKSTMVIKHVYNPKENKVIDGTEKYIDFNSYTKLFNTYSDSVDTFTNILTKK